MRKVCYEWDIEDFDFDPAADDPQAGDIIDHHHEDKLEGFPLERLLEALKREGSRLVLVRDVIQDGEGVIDRTWAYVLDDGSLPGCFEDANEQPHAIVPKRFHAELERITEAA